MEQVSQIPQAVELFQEVSTVLCGLPTTTEKSLFIRQSIIITQDRIMERGDQHIPKEDLVRRIIGEVEELKEFTSAGRADFIPDVALELADIYYYLLQPNVYVEASVPLADISGVLKTYVFDLDLIYSFVIVKYLTRIELTSYNLEKPHRKNLEREVMVLFLQARGLFD